MTRGPDGVCRDCEHSCSVRGKPACQLMRDARGNVSPCLYRMRCANKWSQCPHPDEARRKAWAFAETVTLAPCRKGAETATQQVGNVKVAGFKV